MIYVYLQKRWDDGSGVVNFLIGAGTGAALSENLAAIAFAARDACVHFSQDSIEVIIRDKPLPGSWVEDVLEAVS